MKVWNPQPDSTKVKYEPPEQEFDTEGNEVLRAECHCGGVSFTIPRPTVPAVTEDPIFSKCVSPVDKNKWCACVDACDDCRLTSGAHTIAWTFVPRALLRPPMPVDLAPYGTMKTYASSPGVLRSFCGKCGASVILACDESRPTPEQEVVDVSVGLLRAPEGILAEEWLTWRAGRLSWMESAGKFYPVFAKSLAEGFKKWSIEKYGDAPNFSVNLGVEMS